MANLAHIQHLLNTNQEYRGRFLADPVAALAEQGLVLSFEMQQKVREMVSAAQSPYAAVPGAAAGQPKGTVLQTTPLQTIPFSGLRHIPLIIAFE